MSEDTIQFLEKAENDLSHIKLGFESGTLHATLKALFQVLVLIVEFGIFFLEKQERQVIKRREAIDRLNQRKRR